MTYEPGEFLRRYQTGEREVVWREMTALGHAVRGPPYLDDAWATARETMKRARHNVELIIRRLDGLGYEFWNGVKGSLAPPGFAMSIGGKIVTYESPLAMLRERMANRSPSVPPGVSKHIDALQARFGPLMTAFEAAVTSQAADREAQTARQAAITDHLEDPQVFAPPTVDQTNFVRGLEAKGMFLPLSLRAWVEEVGDVNLAGAHPKLSFWETPDFPGVYADPLEVTLNHFNFLVDVWQEEYDDGGQPEGFEATIGIDPQLKARLAVADELLDEGYELDFPNRAADGLLRLDGREAPFVDYLRNAFQWGGFPGWAGRPDAPQAELRHLTEGLLPI